MDNFKNYLVGDNKRHHLKPRVVSSYISYFNKSLRILNLDENKLFKIKNPKRLNRLRDELLQSPKYKKLSESYKGHINSIFGKYIKYTEKLRNVEDNANDYVEGLILSYNHLLERSSDKKKAKKLLLQKLAFLDNSPPATQKFSKALCKYIGIKDEQEFKSLYKVYLKFQAGKYLEIIISQPKLAAKLIAIKSHIEVLKKPN
jgi:hypothetical protein